MNKGFKVLSSVLAMSMVLASGVFAENEPDYHFDKDQQGLLAGNSVFATPTETEKVEKTTLYKQVYDEEFKKALKEYDKAFNNLKTDVGVVAKLGDARCDAQFALDSANNQLLAGPKLVELAEGIGQLEGPYTAKKAKKDPLGYEDGTIVYGQTYFFGKDKSKMEKLIEENKSLSKMKAEDLNKKPQNFFVDGEKTYLELLNDNENEIKKLYDKVSKDAYQKLVKKVKDNYGTREAADRTYSALTVDAATAAAKINLLNDLAKQYKVTLRTCYLADFTAKVSDKAAKAEDKKTAKKDDVPNTASYFTIFVPTCQLSAPAVKYYGAAQVYDKVLRRPLVCKKVETKVVEVPRFTFDELTAYDVACCCCK